MAKKRGNGEGSIYKHKRHGKKVGYRGDPTQFIQRKAPSAATSRVIL